MLSSSHRAQVRRRALLAAVAAGAVGSLTGCGIRLDRDAPHIPGIKTEAPPADQATLRKLLANVKGTMLSADQDSSNWAKRMAPVHRAQQDRLVQVMATQGMTPAPASTATATGTNQPVPNADPLPLADVEHQLAAEIGSLAGLSARNLPMAAAIGVTHGAAAQLLGKPAEISGTTVPRPAQVPTEILPSLQAAVYVFEVIVAKTPLHSRKKAEATLTALRPTRTSWEAALGKAAPAPPDGYDLPVEPTTDAKRAQLAQRVLTDLVDACAGQVTSTRGDRGSFIGLTNLWVDATAQLWRWGAKPTAFPGLK